MARMDNQSSALPLVSKVGLPTWKRALDLAFLAASAPVAILVGGGVALLVLCGSPGPVFFRQRRVGYKGGQFVCLKFRTMHVDSETDSHRGHTTEMIKSGTPMTKLDAKKDPRVIPLGSLIRATGLDELPQLLNVLRGEMSLVGPRPCIPYEYEVYTEEQRMRFNAVPGLTGLWQVSGKNRTTFNRMIELDVEYSEKKSLWMDVKIIARTLPALITQCQDIRSVRKNAKAKQAKQSSPVAAIGKPVQSL
jgi:lipopolysaccharide/colanic/teichoic acid biosynthesis glycosyltransferase